MFFEVLKVTYHIPITITGATYGRGFRGHLSSTQRYVLAEQLPCTVLSSR
jgi:hypothetical protein